MKALLINPPIHNMIKTNVPQFVDENIGCYPPLGLMYVASYALRNSDHEINILDAQVEDRDIKEEIERIKPDIIGIQATTFTYIDTLLTAKAAKEVSEEIHVCLGGPHVNIYPLETINLPHVDSLILGEGEATFTALLNALSKKSSLDEIPGLVFKNNGRVINTGPKPFITNLDTLPEPTRNLIPYKKYYSLLTKKSPVTTMISSRGCPYRCLFCDRPHLGKIFRARSPKNVVDEMEKCAELKIEEIFFYDDTFTVNGQRVVEICNEILKRDLKIDWDIRARVDTVNGYLLEKLKEAGCKRIHYGVESGNPQILKILRKDISLAKVKEVFKQTKKLGISTLAYFMLGSPTENADQIEQTINFSLELNPDYAHFSITTPFPGTDLYRMGLDKGILKTDYWKEFAINPTKDFIPEIWEEKLSRDELIDFLKIAYKKFYSRPGYIIKELLRVKSIKELKRKAVAGLKVLTS